VHGAGAELRRSVHPDGARCAAVRGRGEPCAAAPPDGAPGLVGARAACCHRA